MNDLESKISLSQIETQWSLILRAGPDGGGPGAQAWREMLVRYAKAVERYLELVTRDSEQASELAQEFAVRFLRGDFNRADPQRGRFRDYVRRAVINLVIDAHRKNRLRPLPLAPGCELAAPELDLNEQEQQFVACWRDELLRRTWSGLEAVEAETGQPFHTVLRLRVDHPDWNSARLAAHLSETFGKPVNANGVRQTLHRARERFVGFLQKEVSDSLGCPTIEERDEEMRNLGLWVYCK